MSKLRIAGVVKESITDGIGIRFVLFVQGCPHHCYGCHNPQTHDFNGGTIVDSGQVLEEFKANPLLSGITFSGGEPFCQAGALADLAEEVISLGKNVTVYSGYTFEQLYKMAEEDKDIMRLLCLADVLIDGKFIMSEKTLLLRFRGSKNQRMIDLKRTMESDGKTVYTFE